MGGERWMNGGRGVVLVEGVEMEGNVMNGEDVGRV